MHLPHLMAACSPSPAFVLSTRTAGAVGQPVSGWPAHLASKRRNPPVGAHVEIRLGLKHSPNVPLDSGLRPSFLCGFDRLPQSRGKLGLCFKPSRLRACAFSSLLSARAQQSRAQASNQQLSLLPQDTSPSALHPSISLILKAFALVASGSCARVGLGVGSCARSLPAAEWTGATLRSGSGWVGRPTKALGFWSSDVFCFAGS